MVFPSCGFMQHVMQHSALYVQREPFCVPFTECVDCVWDVVCYMHAWIVVDVV